MIERIERGGQKEPIYYNPDLEPPVVTYRLGVEALRRDIPSTIEGFHWYPDVRVEYPSQIIDALREIFQEYNEAFTNIVLKNREGPSDYQYLFNPQHNQFYNPFVQIDMTGLTPQFIEEARSMPPDVLREEIRKRIFEIENSLAMYNFMREIFQRDKNPSMFQERFDGALEDLRQRFSRPIALLAVTPEKYLAMLATEFGISSSDPETKISPAIVQKLSGFDAFFGPEQFKEYLEQNNGQCNYLIYTRTSLPVSVLKDLSLRGNLTIPLLENPDIRKIIKANSIMFNIDDPQIYRENPLPWERIVNDTKVYMVDMGLAFPIYNISDLSSEEFNSFLRSKGAPERPILRAKPLVLSYGSYGHIKGTNNAKFRNELRKAIEERGPYIIQPEIMTPIVHNPNDDQYYHYIDRNFFYCDPDGSIHFLGGFRNLMPAERKERLKVHGNKEARWIEITD